MEIDLALLERVEASPAALTVVRFYAWSRPSVSLGKHQDSARAIDSDFCRRAGIEVVRRPTGGRAVLHDDELTYSVISNDRHRFPAGSVGEAYHAIAQALLTGIARLGIDVELAPRSPKSPQAPRASAGAPRPDPCFASPSRHELLHRRRKLAGSAQRRLRRSFLQHGSIPLAIDYGRMAAALGCSESLLRSTMTSLSRAAGRAVAREELESELARSFQGAFGIKPSILPCDWRVDSYPKSGL